MKATDKEKITTEFGSYIRDARENRGILQADIAEQLGVSRSYYCLIEAGKRDIYFTLAMNICQILKLDINEFMKRLK